jgi:hypothetical protein
MKTKSRPKPMTLEKLKELLLLLNPHHAEDEFSAEAPPT